MPICIKISPIILGLYFNINIILALYFNKHIILRFITNKQ